MILSRMFVTLLTVQFLGQAIIYAAQPLTIHAAVLKKDFAAVKRFIEQNPASVNAEIEHQHTPLFTSASSGEEAITALLLKNGASVDHEDDMNTTPLFGAVMNGNTRIVCMLMRHGADPHHEDFAFNTPYYSAKHLGNQTVINLLQNYPQIWQHYRAARLAFSGALHKRLGGASPANVLPQPLLREILEQYVRMEDFAASPNSSLSIMSPARGFIHDHHKQLSISMGLLTFYALIYYGLTNSQNSRYIRAPFAAFIEAFLSGLIWLTTSAKR